MSQGVVIFAYNNETVNYQSMAAWSARNIRRHLNLPTCLITDRVTNSMAEMFDQVVLIDSPKTQQQRYFRDYQAPGTWYNTNRVSAYDLSPWDDTLLLDADYVVASDQLKLLFDLNQDFLCHKRAFDIAGNHAFQGNKSFGTYGMPMNWATVIFFRRSRTAELIFNTMELIRNNWNHYLQLYQIDEYTYRNDYALSIAMNIVEGHTMCNAGIPWQLATVMPETKLTQLDQDTYKLQYQNNDMKSKWMTIQQDFHAMCKRDLGEIIASPK